MNSEKLAWYWHRLRAMGPNEVLGRCVEFSRRRKDRKLSDGWRGFDGPIDAMNPTPAIPDPTRATADILESVERDCDRIRNGKWVAFGRLELAVGENVDWHRDYLAGAPLDGSRSAFDCDHRQLPGGADIKLVWELSRWGALVRLAQSAYLMERLDDAERVLGLVESWLDANPPYIGWNWTSALESASRLLQFCWIDAMFSARRFDARGVFGERWAVVRRRFLPPHVYYTHRYRSRGSSANNHLLGELAGLISALARWPCLAKWTQNIGALQSQLEREIFKQFDAQGGNREQALNYQVYSFELCWRAQLALEGMGRALSAEALDRLGRALMFFERVQIESDPWDYGDSDDAMVAPIFFDEAQPAPEWIAWARGASKGASIRYWLGPPPVSTPVEVPGNRQWLFFPEAGIGRCSSGPWELRWDLSPLGYLSTAAHGHLDALHLSIWLDGVAVVIDPGTGAYYGDVELRNYLASREVHNGPSVEGQSIGERAGPFLWRRRHADPSFEETENGAVGRLVDSGYAYSRRIRSIEDGRTGWSVEDSVNPESPEIARPFKVVWTFGPGIELERVDDRRFRVFRNGVVFEVSWGTAWSDARWIPPRSSDGVGPGICSPGFRQVEGAIGLELTGAPGACVFETTFLACERDER